MKIKKLNIKGFTHVELAIIILVAFGIGLVGYKVYKNTSHAGSNVSTSIPVPGNFIASEGNLSNKLVWDESSDDKVNSYKVLRNGVVIANTTSTSYSDTNVKLGTNYNYSVIAVENFGTSNSKISLPTDIKSVTTGNTFKSSSNLKSNAKGILSVGSTSSALSSNALSANSKKTTLTEVNNTADYNDQGWSGYRFEAKKIFKYVSGSFIVPSPQKCTKVNYDYVTELDFDFYGDPVNLGYELFAECNAKDQYPQWRMAYYDNSNSIDGWIDSLKITNGNTINFSYSVQEKKDVKDKKTTLYLVSNVTNVSKNLNFKLSKPIVYNNTQDLHLGIYSNGVSPLNTYSSNGFLSFYNLYASETDNNYIKNKTLGLGSFDNYREIVKLNNKIYTAETYPLPIDATNFTITKIPDLIPQN